MRIFFDLSKAFGTVDPKMLLGKMEMEGVRGVALSWIGSYLADRKQKIVEVLWIWLELYSHSNKN